MDAYQQTCYEEMYDLIKDDYSQAIDNQLAVWEDRVPAQHPVMLYSDLPEGLAERFPDYNFGEIHYDKAKMLLYGMKQMLGPALNKMDAVPSTRANMGCGIYPSLFPGIKPLLFYDERMPWIADHLSKYDIKYLREKDIIITDEFKIALEHMVHQAEFIHGTGGFVYPLDLQGPFDTAHMVYGDRFFYDLYDDPELIHHLLELSVYAINMGSDECFKIIPESDRYIAHYNNAIIPLSLGGIKISEDTSTLVSAEHIDEFVVPYTSRVLEHAGGGYIHYCGVHDHLLKRMLELDLVCGINFGNPDMHDMDSILRRIAESGKVYYGYVYKSEGEDNRSFFERVTTNATVNGKCRLILEHYVSLDEWDSACQIWREVMAERRLQQ